MDRNTDSTADKPASRQAMSPEAQRIAIAEACPDLFEVHETYASELPDGKFRKYLAYKGEGITGNEIDPLSCLNAMHEAEKVLTGAQVVSYLCTLDSICGCKRDETRTDQFRIVRATAAQRAEAFLRTLNLWTEPVPEAQQTPTLSSEKENQIL